MAPRACFCCCKSLGTLHPAPIILLYSLLASKTTSPWLRRIFYFFNLLPPAKSVSGLWNTDPGKLPPAKCVSCPEKQYILQFPLNWFAKIPPLWLQMYSVYMFKRPFRLLCSRQKIAPLVTTCQERTLQLSDTKFSSRTLTTDRIFFFILPRIASLHW